MIGADAASILDLLPGGAPGTLPGAGGTPPVLAPGVDAGRFVRELAGHLRGLGGPEADAMGAPGALRDAAFADAASDGADALARGVEGARVHPALAQILASLVGMQGRADLLAGAAGDAPTDASGPDAAPRAGEAPGGHPLPVDLVRALGLDRGTVQAALRDATQAAPPARAAAGTDRVADGAPGASEGERASLLSALRDARGAQAAPGRGASSTDLPAPGTPGAAPAGNAPEAAEAARTQGPERALERAPASLAPMPPESHAPAARAERSEATTALERAIERAEAAPSAGGDASFQGRGGGDTGASGRELPPVRSEPLAPGTERSGFELAAGSPAEESGPARPIESAARMPVSRAPELLAARVESLARGGGGVARIRLDPPNLGELHLRVTVRGQSVDVTVVAREAAAQVLVEGGREQLADALAARQLKMEGFDVSGGSRDPGDGGPGLRDGRGAGTGQEPGQGRPGHPEHPARTPGGPPAAAGAGLPGPAPSPTMNPTAPRDTRVDVRV